ncbi:hypothetical protein [Xanthomarina spongicola]|uniref:hypothetical protein n=1 Tax=Xanthomarina spongicola TaxID=570520 RepID=UPI001474496D|nr:hypothetical protein [Xanthomarina spongicola]
MIQLKPNIRPNQANQSYIGIPLFPNPEAVKDFISVVFNVNWLNIQINKSIEIVLFLGL